MPDRHFLHSPDGINSHGYKLTCKKCKSVGILTISNSSGNLPPDIINKKMKQRGWHVGHNDRQDICPSCNIKHKAAVVDRPTQPVLVPETETPMPNTVVAMAPKVAGKEENLIIIDKLKEVYIDEKNGYQEGWNDERVAKDMGIPRAWVTPIREQFFGPEKSVATESLLNECKAALADAKQALVEVRGIEGKIMAKIAVLERRLGQIAA